MARHILIVDESDMMRRVLCSRILSLLDDAVIFEARGAADAKELIGSETIHLVLYSWDIQDEAGLQFCTRLAAGEEGQAIPFLFLISDKKEHVAMATDLVGKSFLVMPCSPESLTRAIERVCSPVTLRQAKRYSINDTIAVIEQRQVASEAAVVNISTGGALCEFELDPLFNCAYTLMLSLQFKGEDGPVTINDLHAVISTVKVMTRHADQTPKRIRAGVKFLGVAAEDKDILAQLFAQVEEE